MNQLELLPPQNDDIYQDGLLPQGITKAALDTIFEDSLPDDALTQSELAKRFGVNDSTVKRAFDKGGEHFLQWSFSLDPEKKIWQYTGEFVNPKTNRLSKYFRKMEIET